MSMEANYYVIAGYDLTNLKTDEYMDWKWTDEGEQFLCYQSKGRIQLFDDPAHSDGHLYLGKILASGDEWEFKTTKFGETDVKDAFYDVCAALDKLISAGVISKDPKCNLVYEVIAFVEYR